MSANQYPNHGDGQSTAGLPVETMSQSRCFCSEVYRCAFCQLVDGQISASAYNNAVETHGSHLPYSSSLLNHQHIQTAQYPIPSNINVEYSNYGIPDEDSYPSPPLDSGFTEERECRSAQ
jgi:hypothetical protein